MPMGLGRRARRPAKYSTSADESCRVHWRSGGLEVVRAGIRPDLDRGQTSPSRSPRKNFRSPLDRQPLEASVQEMGTVKWYNAAKGFGFIVLDGGGNDVFVHVSALQRAGIMGLNEGQRVFVGVAEGQRGPEAASIRVAY